MMNYHCTSQSFTFFIISFSRASAACSRRYASLSPSARSSGTRCMRDQIFSRWSSLVQGKTVASPISHLSRSRSPQPTARSFNLIRLRHAAGSHTTPRSPLGSTHHLTRFSFPTPVRSHHPPFLSLGKVRTSSQGFPFRHDRTHMHTGRSHHREWLTHSARAMEDSVYTSQLQSPPLGAYPYGKRRWSEGMTRSDTCDQLSEKGRH